MCYSTITKKGNTTIKSKIFNYSPSIKKNVKVISMPFCPSCLPHPFHQIYLQTHYVLIIVFSFSIFLLDLSIHFEPPFYFLLLFLKIWKKLWNLKFGAMEINNTWSIVSLPGDKYSIGYKWIYKAKQKTDRSIERYKVCLVANGYTQ